MEGVWHLEDLEFKSIKTIFSQKTKYFLSVIRNQHFNVGTLLILSI
jgi:hypothetical protein